MTSRAKLRAATAAVLLFVWSAAAHAAEGPAKPTYLTAAEIAPAVLLPPPPADGSIRQTAEIAEVRRLVAARTPERMAKAHWDDQHEDWSIFAATLGPAFDIAKLPATAALLQIVRDEGGRAENAAKAYFGRQRPWAFDASIDSCDAGQNKNPRSSYPSGHSMSGYSLGLALAQLMPEHGQAILARASDYAYSREICAAHYRSDTEASHALASTVVATLWTKPQLAPKIAAARAELQAAGLTHR